MRVAPTIVRASLEGLLNCRHLLAAIDYIRPNDHPFILALFRTYFEQ